MNSLLYISFFILTAYIIYAVVQVGITPSLSESYYRIKRRWLFPLVMGLTGAIMMIYLFRITDGKWYQFLSFFSTAPLLFVAIAPNYKQLLEGEVHRIAAYVSAISSVVLMILLGYWQIPTIFLLLGLVISHNVGNRVFWLEMACFASVFSTLFFLR